MGELWAKVDVCIQSLGFLPALLTSHGAQVKELSVAPGRPFSRFLWAHGLAACSSLEQLKLRALEVELLKPDSSDADILHLFSGRPSGTTRLQLKLTASSRT